jgi:ATP-dependent Clp protease ATP-binding subunit ClpC
MDNFSATYPSEQLAPATQKIFAQAENEARALNHNYIGTEHLLIALLTDQENIATHVLQAFAVTADKVRKALAYIMQRQQQKQEQQEQSEMPPVGQPIGFTARANATIGLAISEAARIQQKLVTPEALLIGIIREGEGLAAGILRSLGVDLEKVRAQVYAYLIDAGKTTSSAPPKANVITCRIDNQDTDAIDALVEAGVRTSRSEAAAWLIHAGIVANAQLLETVYGTVAEIRRLRVVAKTMAQDAQPTPAQEA